MIENTVVGYLESDATLDTLLSSTVSDSKFYIRIPKKEPTLPYVLFSVMAGAETDEHIDEDRIQFTICAATKVAGDVIAKRIKVLLDVKDAIQDNIYSTDSDFYIYTSKYSGGDVLFDPIRSQWQVVLFFNIQYQAKLASR